MKTWMLVVCGLSGLMGCSGESSEPRAFSWNDALYLCQSAIKQISVDPDSVDIPYVKNMGTGDEYYFAWGLSTKHIRMNNRIGLDVPVSAMCIVDGNLKKIIALSLNGKSIIG